MRHLLQPGGPGGFGSSSIREAPYEVASAEPREDAERLLRAFPENAYRRSVAEANMRTARELPVLPNTTDRREGAA